MITFSKLFWSSLFIEKKIFQEAHSTNVSLLLGLNLISLTLNEFMSNTDHISNNEKYCSNKK